MSEWNNYLFYYQWPHEIRLIQLEDTDEEEEIMALEVYSEGFSFIVQAQSEQHAKALSITYLQFCQDILEEGRREWEAQENFEDITKVAQTLFMRHSER